MRLIKTRAYCPYCKAERELARPKFSWPAFIVISIVTLGWGLILYPFGHWALTNKTKCHTCQGTIASYWTRNPLFKEENESQDKKQD